MTGEKALNRENIRFSAKGMYGLLSSNFKGKIVEMMSALGKSIE
jgi:hypothetical protein